jgi:hypothetical protein
MTSPIQRIQEIQQKKIQAEEQRRRRIDARRNREINAFVASPVYQLLSTMWHMPLQQKYRADIGPILAHAIRNNREDVLAGKTSIVAMARHGSMSGVMWRCEELESGNICYSVDGVYGFKHNAVGAEGIQLFEDSFVEYVAEILDPACVTETAGTYVAPTETTSTRDNTPKRVIQAIT